jgi:large subunit ribosomal protein LP2
MKHIAAYALLVLGGKPEPSEADVEKLLKEVGATADKESLKALVSALKGKALHELVAAGKDKLASVSVAAAGAPVAAAAGGAAAAKEEEPAKEEEVDMDMGGLFGGDDDDY